MSGGERRFRKAVLKELYCENFNVHIILLSSLLNESYTSYMNYYMTLNLQAKNKNVEQLLKIADDIKPNRYAMIDRT